jgi:hypothetical protein
MSTALARRWDYWDDEEQPEDQPEVAEAGRNAATDWLEEDNVAGLLPPAPISVNNSAYSSYYNQNQSFSRTQQSYYENYLPTPAGMFGADADFYDEDAPRARRLEVKNLLPVVRPKVRDDYALTVRRSERAQPQPSIIATYPWLKPVAMVAVVGLILALTLSWLSGLKNSDEFEIYSFGSAAGSVTINKQQAQAATSANPPSNAPVPTGQNSVEGKPSISVAKIEEVLRSYNSPAVGTGQVMYDLGVKYGIDPAYALAFFVHESTAGTKGVAVATKSIGNIRYTANSGFQDHQGFRKYPSWEAGIEDWYKLIRNLYINGWGKRTVETIIPTYAPAADRNNPPAYINGVNTSVAKWRSGN